MIAHAFKLTTLMVNGESKLKSMTYFFVDNSVKKNCYINNKNKFTTRKSEGPDPSVQHRPIYST